MPRLTEVVIRNCRPEKEKRLSDGGCLFCQVRRKRTSAAGYSYTWIVRIKRTGKPRVHNLGTFPEVGIKHARADAARIVAIERGTARLAVREAVELYMDESIRPRYKRLNNTQVYARRLQNRLGTLTLDAVRSTDVSRMLADYLREGHLTAPKRMFAYAGGFFSWCVEKGLLERSPMADMRARAIGPKEQARERILSDEEINALWHAPDLPHRALLRFLLLTGVRIGEAQAARASWLDADGWLHLPADVMKNGKPHLARVWELARLQIEPAAAPSLFRVVSPTAVQAAVHRWLDRHMGAEVPQLAESATSIRWTPHDLRRTFASRCGDLGAAPHVIAKMLAHTFTPSASLPTYLRSEWFEERKAAANALAAHIEEVVRPGGSRESGEPTRISAPAA